MKCLRFVAALAMTGAVFAQTGAVIIPRYEPLAQVKQFLSLSDAQVETITRNIREQQRLDGEKQMRVSQLHFEISVETAKPTVDPLALGLRYAEIEKICRDLRADAPNLLKKNIEGLTPPQRTKLQVLEEAVKLGPVIAEAQGASLLGSSLLANRIPSVRIDSGLLTGISNLAGGNCGGSSPIFRNIPIFAAGFPLGITAGDPGLEP